MTIRQQLKSPKRIFHLRGAKLSWPLLRRRLLILPQPKEGSPIDLFCNKRDAAAIRKVLMSELNRIGMILKKTNDKPPESPFGFKWCSFNMPGDKHGLPITFHVIEHPDFKRLRGLWCLDFSDIIINWRRITLLHPERHCLITGFK